MLCKSPYMLGSAPVGCGQCLPCRINRRRLWTTRCFLESLCHDENCFVTLTYNDEHLPDGNSLVPGDLRDFLKRLRSYLEPEKIRFFGVGEYGESGQRGVNPHYHLSVFGAGPHVAPLVARAWSKEGVPFGHTMTAEFNRDTAQYVCGYVIKKLTRHGDPRLGNRHPEFARMSNRPGIGAPAVAVLAESLGDNGYGFVGRTGDVPMSVMVDGKKLGLGRYLRSKLRDEFNMTEEQKNRIVQRWYDEKFQEMLGLLNDPKVKKEGALSFKGAVLAKNKQALASLEARDKITNSKKGTL